MNQGKAKFLEPHFDFHPLIWMIYTILKFFLKIYFGLLIIMMMMVMAFWGLLNNFQWFFEVVYVFFFFLFNNLTFDFHIFKEFEEPVHILRVPIDVHAAKF